MPDPAVPHGFDLAVAKTYITTTRSTEDVYVAGVLRGVHGFARGHIKRQLKPSPLEHDDGPVTERVITQGSRFVRVPDVREIDEVRVDGRVVTEYEQLRLPHEDSPVVRLELYTRGWAVEVDGWFGFDFTDDEEDVHELADAIYAHAARVFHERTAMYADILSSAEYGTQTYLRSLPPRVRDVYELYKVPSDWFGIS